MVCLKRWTVTRFCRSDGQVFEAVDSMLVQQVLHAMDAQAFAPGTGKQDLPVTALSLAQPGGQDGQRGLGNRRTAFLAALADHAQVRARPEDEIVAREPGHLRQAQAGLHGHQHEGVIAPAGPCVLIRSSSKASTSARSRNGTKVRV